MGGFTCVLRGSARIGPGWVWSMAFGAGEREREGGEDAYVCACLGSFVGSGAVVGFIGSGAVGPFIGSGAVVVPVVAELWP